MRYGRFSDDRMRSLYATRVLRALEDEADVGPSGDLLMIKKVRARTRLGKRAFDRAVLDLQKLGRVTLHHHDAPHHVDAATREKWVFDPRGHGGQGTYYVGIALR